MDARDVLIGSIANLAVSNMIDTALDALRVFLSALSPSWPGFDSHFGNTKSIF